VSKSKEHPDGENAPIIQRMNTEHMEEGKGGFPSLANEYVPVKMLVTKKKNQIGGRGEK
jgi:hypothetical protein